ncbi:MAG: hypothetical protein CME36_04395 [unclassified Hahellaceae]|nr:hypothetical protein [Hahellaceae bacterium]
MAVLSVACISALASAEALLVERAGANVEYRHTAKDSWQSLAAGSSLTLPVEVRTLAGAEAVISQSGSTFSLKPDTHLSFKGRSNENNGLVARVKQWIGTAFYKIERQPDEFSVETPFLVSTVKGTQFVIVSTEADSFVTLTEGSLQVLDLDTGNSQMIAPGEIAGSSAGEAKPRTYNQQNPQASATGTADASSGSPAAASGQQAPVNASSDKSKGSQGQSTAPGQTTAPVSQTLPGRGSERGQGRDTDRGRGFAAALEAIDEVRAEQIQTRDTRNDRPLSKEDIRAAREDAAKGSKGDRSDRDDKGPGNGNGKSDRDDTDAGNGNGKPDRDDKGPDPEKGKPERDDLKPEDGKGKGNPREKDKYRDRDRDKDKGGRRDDDDDDDDDD